MPTPTTRTRRTMTETKTGPTEPTDKQVAYALHLLAKAGYSTRYMNASYKALGASMRERSGMVEDWLRSKTRAEISALIDRLLK